MMCCCSNLVGGLPYMGPEPGRFLLVGKYRACFSIFLLCGITLGFKEKSHLEQSQVLLGPW
ncbi:unnamed protein product [Ixodes persulcatus]